MESAAARWWRCLPSRQSMLVAELRTPRWSLPRVLYIVGLAVMVGLALRPRSLFLFLVIWTSQHWILATGLASQTPSAESTPTTGVVRRFLHRLNVRPWAVVLFLMLLSLVLLPIFEVEANRETGTYYGDRIFGALATQLRTSTLGACVARSRIRDGIYSLPARSKRLSNVGSASARGSVWA